MCDYSLASVQSRAARVGDKLTVKNFGSGTRGFASAEDAGTVVCVLPGTELAFDDKIHGSGDWYSTDITYEHTTAIFRQVDKEKALFHHDAVEMPDGQIVKLTYLVEGQTATVLQLPATPKTEAEAKEQERVDVVA